MWGSRRSKGQAPTGLPSRMNQVSPLRANVKGFVNGNVRSTYYHGMNKDPYKERDLQDDNNMLNDLENEENLDNLEEDDNDN